MSPLLRSFLRAPRATAALLLGVFLLGAAVHGLHHLQDPSCAGGVDRDGHACAVCAGLHASTLVPATIVAPTPQPLDWARPAVPVAVAPDLRPHRATAPRAPPAS